METSTGREYGEFAQRVEEVELPFLPPGLKVFLVLHFHFGGVSPECGGAEAVGHGLKLGLLVPFEGIIDNARAEEGFHEAVDIFLGEDVVRGAEEEFLDFGADEKGETLVEEPCQESIEWRNASGSQN